MMISSMNPAKTTVRMGLQMFVQVAREQRRARLAEGAVIRDPATLADRLYTPWRRIAQPQLRLVKSALARTA